MYMNIPPNKPFNRSLESLESFPASAKPVLRWIILTLESQEAWNELKLLKLLDYVRHWQGEKDFYESNFQMRMAIKVINYAHELRENFAQIWKQNLLAGFDDFTLTVMTETLQNIRKEAGDLRNKLGA